MHEWICKCLPDIPPRTNDADIQIYFKNAFLGTILTCSYKKNEGIFSSDSVSTIAILKEVITKEVRYICVMYVIFYLVHMDVAYVQCTLDLNLTFLISTTCAIGDGS